MYVLSASMVDIADMRSIAAVQLLPSFYSKSEQPTLLALGNLPNDMVPSRGMMLTFEIESTKNSDPKGFSIGYIRSASTLSSSLF